MNVREIAKLSGVSPATVSRALNNNSLVASKTLKKIEDTINQYNYKKPTRQKKSQMVGIMVPKFEHEFFSCIVAELDAIIRKNGKNPIVIPHIENVIDFVNKIPLEGVILLHEEVEASVISYFKKMQLPMVMCGALSLTNTFSSVHIDDLGAAYEGTTYLLGLGHKKIGFIADNPFSISSGFQRMAGCKKAFEDYGVAFEEDLVFFESNDYTGGYNCAKKLLEKNITAIFALNDVVALGAMAAIIDSGLNVPSDISVLGFDGIPKCEQFRPKLTTVKQPIRDIGECTVQLLIDEIENFGENGVRSIVLPHELMIQNSCSNLKIN